MTERPSYPCTVTTRNAYYRLFDKLNSFDIAHAETLETKDDVLDAMGRNGLQGYIPLQDVKDISECKGFHLIGKFGLKNDMAEVELHSPPTPTNKGIFPSCNGSLRLSEVAYIVRLFCWRCIGTTTRGSDVYMASYILPSERWLSVAYDMQLKALLHIGRTLPTYSMFRVYFDEE